ncbi:M66 family metalloprotease [Rheinheimera baltica]|uniref:InlB B-repeat-containing protein n=1 Tax=Rheinheimera baltica TaxID=67576 RepID=UPI00273FCCAB|nr:leucine-rich repeat domain-containing protein [Rheinheimera baltica]MDP5143058.1 M66 family metalloprotease [Rheinheimera baltica]
MLLNPRIICLALPLWLLGCGGGSGDDAGTKPPEVVSYTVSATAGAGGSITPASVSVRSGQTATLTLQADAGFVVASATGCNGQLNGNSFTTGAISENCTVTASFERAQINVSTAIEGSGSITPQSLTLLSDQQATLKVTPAEGFATAAVTGCNGALTDDQYLIGPLNANCTVTARFEPVMFEVTSRAGAGGVVSPASQQVQYGQQATFSILPDDGFVIQGVTGCAGTLEGNSFTTTPVMAACEVDVSFVVETLSITAVAGAGGSVSPTSVEANFGDKVVFTITADSGFNVQQVDGCNGQFDGAQFIIPSVTEDCQLQVQFNDAEFVVFADANLDRVVREHLALSDTAPILADTLAGLTALNADNQQISRLDGIQYATGLRQLVLQNNSLTDVGLLAALADNQAENPRLSTLYLGYNSLTHLPDLSGFSRLVNLSMPFTKIADLSPLAGLTNLEQLDVSGNNISDLSPLSALPILRLTIYNNPLSTDALWALQGMSLQFLFMGETKIDSLEPLSSQTQLRLLGIEYTRVSDLSVLSYFPELRQLTSYGTAVTDLSPLLDTNLGESGYVSVGGCLKLNGFSRAQSVIDGLSAKGVVVQVYNWAKPRDIACPNQDGIDTLDVSAQLSNNGLQLDWQVASDDAGPWRCELHVDLDYQLPRAPVAVLDNCHLQQQWLLPDITQARIRPFFVLDTGLAIIPRQITIDEVINTDMPPTGVSIAGTDWLQGVVKTNPYLVPNRDAVLRVHLVSADGATPPALSAVANRAGQAVALAVQAPATLPPAKQHGELSSSYLVSVPAAQMQPGTTFEVSVAGLDNVVLSPTFALANSINLTVVPFQVGDAVTTLPDNSLISRSLLTTWPLASVNITTRAPYQVSASAEENNTSTMLQELFDLRVIEGGEGYYYGYFEQAMNTDQWGGRGYVPGFSAVGVVNSSNLDMVLNHELGHNFGRPHAPCGTAGNPDSAYPYAGGSTGSYGVPLDMQTLLSPDDYKDLMGYCGNQHVSDYNFENVQDYLQQNLDHPAIELQLSATMQAAGTSLSATATGEAWYHRMALTGADQVQLQQLILLQQQRVVRANSPYQVSAWYVASTPQQLAVEQLVPGHGDGPVELSFIVPVHWQNQALTRWSLYRGDKLVHDYRVPANQRMPAAQSRAVAASAANGVTLQEINGDICVDVTSNTFDAMNLLWRDAQQQVVVALNVTEPAFCRSVAVPAGGAWQLQLRRGINVELIEQAR